MSFYFTVLTDEHFQCNLCGNTLKHKRHLKHHFKDSNQGYGVTTTILDWVFGTNFPKNK